MASKPKVLKQKEIDKKLKDLSSWEINKKATQISKTFKTTSFISGLAFLAKVTVLSEVSGHHPDVELSYGKVKIKLSTHDVKGLTRLDFELARKIDNINLTNY